MRYGRTEMRTMFHRLLDAMGKKIHIGTGSGMVLNFMSEDGGYVIAELSENGECAFPFGEERRNAKDMYLSMLMAAQALEYVKHEKKR